MDGQQRLIMQLCGRALATVPPLGESSGLWASIGVFVGISTTDYSKLTTKHNAPISAYAATGSAMSVACGRVSYFYGASWPSLSVDTACSS